jgi:hypothetical protein
MSVAGAQFYQALYTRATTVAGLVLSPDLRREGDPTPAMSYEITSASFSVETDGRINEVTAIEVRWEAVADSLITAWDLAWSVRGAIDGKWGVGSLDFVLTSASMSSGMATPDDGQGDAERVVTLTTSFLVMETT